MLFRELADPDEKRKELLWLACIIIVVLAGWVLVALMYGIQPSSAPALLALRALCVGIGVSMILAIGYLIIREREHRSLNRKLVTSLRDSIGALNERVERLNALTAMSSELAGNLDVDRISELVVNALVSQVRANVSSIVLVDSESGKPIFSRTSTKEGDSVAETSGVEMLAANVESQSVAKQISAWEDLRRVISAPVKSRSDLSGELRAHRAEDQAAFTPEDLNLLTTLANMASKAIESAELHKNLKEAYLNTLRSLTNSLQARDNYTAKHSERAADLAVRIARQLDLPEEQIETVKSYAPLHDVGKIGIRDEILNKPGQLTPEERAIFSTHSAIGEQIVAPLKPPPEALAMMRHHHEDWNGEGYPDHLSREQIPLLARILRVADAYDAIISRRPYSGPNLPQQAVEEILDQAGEAFDPVAAQALAEVVGNQTSGPATSQQAIA